MQHSVPFGHFIGGAIVSPSGTSAIDVFDPASAERIAEVASASASDIDQAVAAARETFDKRKWRGLNHNDRSAALWSLGDLLARHAEEFAELEVRDNGMPLAFARGTIAHAVNGIRYNAGAITKLYGQTSEISSPGRDIHAYTVNEPVGVVAAISPWNAPLGAMLNKIVPAVAAGCSVVAKPAEQTPLSALRLGELLAESRIFPDGLINIVNGTGQEAGAAMASHPDVDKISFTGSTEVGKILVRAASKDLKRLTLELGGKSPLFVFDDADLDLAATIAAAAIFNNSGQVCFAGSLLFAQRGIYDALMAAVAAKAERIRIGNGLDPQTQMGPLVSSEQLQRVMQYVEIGVADGAELVTGGSRATGPGYFMHPTVFGNRDRKPMRIVTEEIFGPVLTIQPFDDLEEIEQLANSSAYGLAAGVVTQNLSKAHRAVKMIRAGTVWINGYGFTDRSLPFGGFRQSGWGRENGMAGIGAYLESKTVYAVL